MKVLNICFYMECLNYSKSSLQKLHGYIYIVSFCSYWLSLANFPKMLPLMAPSTCTNIDNIFCRSLQPRGLAETLCGSPLYMAPEIMQLQKYDAKVASTFSYRNTLDFYLYVLLLTLNWKRRQISGVLVPFYFSL